MGKEQYTPLIAELEEGERYRRLYFVSCTNNDLLVVSIESPIGFRMSGRCRLYLDDKTHNSADIKHPLEMVLNNIKNGDECDEFMLENVCKGYVKTMQDGGFAKKAKINVVKVFGDSSALVEAIKGKPWAHMKEVNISDGP